MTEYEIISLVVAGFALLVSILAYLGSRENNLIAQQNIKLVESISKGEVNMFKRQGVIELHMAWRGVNEINPQKLIGPDVVKAVDALSLTSSLWNHDVIEKNILHQSYWYSFQTLYDTLNTCNELVPGFKKTCKDFLTNEIRKVYSEMNTFNLNQVKQTTISNNK